MFMYVNDVDYVKDVDVNAQTLRLQRLKPASYLRLQFLTETKQTSIIMQQYMNIFDQWMCDKAYNLV